MFIGADRHEAFLFLAIIFHRYPSYIEEDLNGGGKPDTVLEHVGSGLGSVPLEVIHTVCTNVHRVKAMEPRADGIERADQSR